MTSAERSRQYRARIRAIVQAAKDKPCADCGVKYPYYVMDFDHVRGAKKFELRHAPRFPVPAILEEIQKCDVVCANCHRVRTQHRVVL